MFDMAIARVTIVPGMPLWLYIAPFAHISLCTATGLLGGKLLYRISKGRINPLLGAAAVSAVPMSARVVENEGFLANPNNHLLMHAMGPNVAGVIGTSIAAGVLLSLMV